MEVRGVSRSVWLRFPTARPAIPTSIVCHWCGQIQVINPIEAIEDTQRQDGHACWKGSGGETYHAKIQALEGARLVP
jgi:MinD superfamily P-loop ATPase